MRSESFSTEEPEEFPARLSTVTPPFRIRPEGRSFVSSAHLARLSKLGLFVARARQTRVIAKPLDAVYSLNFALHAPLEVRRGQSTLTVQPGKAWLADPEDELDIFLPGDSPILVANIRAEVIAHQIAGVGSTKSIPSLGGEISLFTAAGSQLFEGISILWSATFAGGGTSHGGAEVDAELEDALIEALVSATSKRGEPRPRRQGIGKALTRAEEYIHAHLNEHLSLPLVAQAAETSPRTLNRAFHDVHGLTPMGYAKRQRLAAARRALIGSSPDETTVARIAAEHGFTHLGRFGREYRHAFGERPSDAHRVR